MMEFQRRYQCQDSAEDSLSVAPFDEDMLRFVAESDTAVISAHLNRVQVVNFIELCTAWVGTVQEKTLWEDV